MSKSVDDTVVDFFNLLLMEKSEVVQAQPIIKAAASAKDKPYKAVDYAKANPLVKPVTHNPSFDIQKVMEVAQVSRDVDKKALEKLLEAVSFATPGESVEEGIKAKAELIRQAIKLQPAAMTETKKSVNKPLVDKDIVKEADTNVAAAVPKSVAINVVEELDNLNPIQTQTGSVPPSITKDLQEVLDDEFQVLFFNIAGLTLAVPLVSLGGIVKIERISHIIGRPKWFKGVQTHRDATLNVVDTCAWVMPEKYSQELAESIDYQYLVLLEDSEWGLACESLVNAVKINKSHVNWRDKPGKRPWLAGVVKEQMCGILHVQALIEMLDAGLGCQDSIDRG